MSPPRTSPKLWEFATGSVYNPPVVAPDGTIYVVGGNPGPKLYALTPAGVQKWLVPLGPSPGGALAVAADGTIYVGANGSFRAYTPDGNLIWSNAFPTRLFSSPAIAHDGTIYVSTGELDGKLYALAPDGTVKWSFAAAGIQAEAPVIGADGTIYFGSYDDGFYAINPDGTRRWYYQMYGYRTSAAIGGDGIVYVAGSIFPSKLFAFTPEGTKIWETQIGPSISQGASPPVFAPDGTIYVGLGHDLKLYAFNPDGSAKWSFTVGGAGGGATPSPAVDSQGNIYAVIGSSFAAITPDRSLLWSFSTNGVFTSPTLTRDGTIYVGNAAGRLYAFRADAGFPDTPWPMFQRDPRHTGAAPLGPVTNLPVVSVEATIPLANESRRITPPRHRPLAEAEGVITTNVITLPRRTTPGPPPSRRPSVNVGRFTITRAGGSSNALTVHYSVSGTASNGVDYVRLSGTALFPAGVRSMEVVVAPNDDNLVEGDETVVLTLTRKSTYHVGLSNSAVVTIHDSHRIPTVTMITPANGAVVPAGTNVLLGANALGRDSPVTKVEFFEGERNLGIADGPLRTPHGMYLLTWHDVPPGLYTLRAKATDNAGGHAFSDPISIVVLAPTNIWPPGTRLWEFDIDAAYSAPAVGTDGTVYIVGGNPNGKLYALTPLGTKKWDRDVGGPVGWPAVAADGTVYVGADRAFRAYNQNGDLLWSADLGSQSSAPAIAEDGTIYVGTGFPDKTLYALRPDGSLKWKFVVTSTFADVNTPVIGGDGTVYFGSYYDGFYALNPDGTRRWYVPMQGYNISAAIGGDGTVYVVGAIWPNKLFAFTPDGVKKWEAPLGPNSQGASPPVIGADGTIFVRCDLDLKIYAFNPNGSTKWSFARGGNTGGFSSSPTVDSQGNVYSGSGPGFFAFGPTGSRLWSFATNAGFTAATLTREGILYVAADTTVYAIRANAGLGQDPWPMFQRDPRRTGAAALVELDTDGDGVPDPRDQCPGTPSGSVVNTQGCNIGQLCPCDGNWRNHREYVRCVIEHAWEFYRAQLIGADERRATVRAAVRSDCDRQPRSSEPLVIDFCPQTREECQREGVRVVVAGEAAGRCTIEVSSDLIHWSPLTEEATVGDEITLSISSEIEARFYRVRVSP